MKRVGIIIACLLYVISPIDVLPDVFPLVGQVDDLGAIIVAIQALFAKK